MSMAATPFVPAGFVPPTTLVGERFRLEPLGPHHNDADHAAWTSSIDHVRSTPGFPHGDWPPLDGMSLERNLDDLRRHADDFVARTGFTFTVLDPVTDDVIGCVYLYPSRSLGRHRRRRDRSIVGACESCRARRTARRASRWSRVAVDPHRPPRREPWHRAHRPGR